MFAHKTFKDFRKYDVWFYITATADMISGSFIQYTSNEFLSQQQHEKILLHNEQ